MYKPAPPWLKRAFYWVFGELGFEMFDIEDGRPRRDSVACEDRAVACLVLHHWKPPLGMAKATLWQIAEVIGIQSHASVSDAIRRAKERPDLREKATAVLRRAEEAGEMDHAVAEAPEERDPPRARISRDQWRVLTDNETVDVVAQAIAESMHEIKWRDLPPEEKHRYKVAARSAKAMYDLALD